MELWIRSQDKMKLVNNCNLYISNEIRNEYVIEDLSNKYLKLGTYKTKKRALEVLNEINEIKYYKYMAELDWTSFVNSVLKEKSIEEQQLLLSMMNTYNIPKE